MPSPPSLPRTKSCSPQSPPPEEMTQQNWEEVFEVEYQWTEERYQSFQRNYMILWETERHELSEEEYKKLEEIIDNDIENKY